MTIRRQGMGISLLAGIAIGALAVVGCSGSGGGPSAAASGDGPAVSPAAKAFLGNSVVQKRGCVTCHAVGGQGGTVGPSLDQVGNRRSNRWLRRWLADPNAVKQGTKMPNFQLDDTELDALVALLSALRRDVDSQAILKTGGATRANGRRLFEAYDCFACHRVGNRGRFVGPNLTWLARRRPPAWEVAWLNDPSKVKPGTFMPTFGFSAPERDALVAYLHTLAGQDNESAQRWEADVQFFLNARPRDVGEMVYRRFGCDGCHGARGEGGYTNPNASPRGMMPHLRTAGRDMTREALTSWVMNGSVPPTIAADAADPLPCPSWRGAMTEEEASTIYEFLKSIAPRKKQFRFKRK